ncbi:hypothetical protein M9H77_08091 [Catharanthus roseus]|uniref:Uncharacterized protein n=1 Tax=Catharanthus roseus TaxID=4058 RepID=A0ACC0BX55_CATRO|nr:hypothetical protein M9H77_08091 [Catharanthus roseus]
MRFLIDLLHQISTGPISKVRKIRRFAKRVLNTVLPVDPGVTLTSPPEVAVTKGQKKTNSTKRDKSHWEHVSIAHRKIRKSSGSGSSSGTGSGSWSDSGSRSGSHGRRGPPRAPRGSGRGRDRGRSSLSSVIHQLEERIGDGNCGYRVVADFVFGDEHQWPEVRRRMLYELEHSTNLGSTIVLALYSYSDRPGGTLVIGLLTEQQYFIQLQLNDGCPIPPLHVQ